MANNFMTYKIAPRNISLDKDDLKKIVDFVVQKTTETKDTTLQAIKLGEMPENQAAEIRTTADEAYKTAVFIYGQDGEELLVYDSGVFDKPEFPETIKRITIDSFIPYRNRVGGGTPRNGIRIDLDFSSAKIVDWQTNVSAPTPNMSDVLIQGLDENLNGATLRYLQRLFTSCRNYRNFLHAAFSYDVYLWLFFMPLYFWAMVLLDHRIDSWMTGIALPIRIAIYVYSFFVAANIYRFLIGYVRWTFQTIEYSSARSTQQRHRRFWLFLATAIVLPIILRLALPK